MQVMAMCAEAFITASVLYGIGNHEAVLSLPDLVTCNLWSWIGQIVAIMALVFARIAAIVFFLSIQGPTHRKLRQAVYAVVALQGLVNTIEVVLILKQCTPTQKLWNPAIPGTCNLIKICSQVGYLQGGKQRATCALANMSI